MTRSRNLWSRKILVVRQRLKTLSELKSLENKYFFKRCADLRKLKIMKMLINFFNFVGILLWALRETLNSRLFEIIKAEFNL